LAILASGTSTRKAKSWRIMTKNNHRIQYFAAGLGMMGNHDKEYAPKP
jgi:hypothetical protein